MTNTHAPTGAFKAFAVAVVCALSVAQAGCVGGNDGSGNSDRSAPSGIHYASNPLDFTIGVVASSTPSLTGSATQFSISPSSLPAGLSFDTVTGTISGTPTALTAAATYRVDASNGFGSDFASVQIAVVDVAPTISYSGSTTVSYHVGEPITDITPTLGGGATVSCAANPSLPAGLTLSSQCVLSGTPTAPLVATNIAIAATNTGGSASFTLNLTVIDNPPVLSYAGGTQTLTNGEAITTISPTNAGGAVVSCTVSPSLPTGLNLGESCSITGTPSGVSAAANYTVTGTNSGGSVDAVVSILVQDVPPNIAFAGSPFAFTINHAASGGSATNSGGAIESCTVSPSLPAGLSVSNTTCAISGTPTAITASATYTITAGNTAGSSNAPITLAVNDVAPIIAYPGTPYRFTDHAAITPAAPVSSGGTVTSCISTPALPNGLSLSSLCTITGTPTDGQSATSYTVTGTNSGGSGNATISIQIAEIAPSLSYAGSPFTYNKAVTIPVLTPSSTGGPITSCASSPVLPSGLSLSAQCVISGTPSAIAVAANYTVTAANAGGTASTTISITVNDTPPVISYPGTPYTFYHNQPISPANAVNSGGAVVSCSASPSLPTGLTLSSGCVITGTPTVVAAAANYTITATNTGGSGPATVNITIADSPPVISYVGSPFAYTVNSAIPTLNPINTGGGITGCSAAPALPAGLALSSGCVLTGTPTAIAAAAGYVVTASNTSGTSSTAITVAVNDVAPSISYSPAIYAFTKNTAITAVTPTATGGAIVSCSASPTLPAGLSLAATTCAITGTPTANSAGTSYAITATNTGGSSTFAITIGVADLVPNIAYTGTPFTFVKGTGIASQIPTNSGGVITSCGASPALPAGLALSTACVLSGTPTVVSADVIYVITATNSGGSASTSIDITVNDIAPTLAYSGSPYTFSIGTAVSQVPTDSGGGITGCSSSPPLPSGLSLSTACVLSGTPTAQSSATNYTVTGTNTGGSANFTISIAVNQVVPVISYPASPVVYQKGTAISPLNPTSTGGTITSCSVSPALPGGLNLNTSTCVVTGNPNAIAAAANYTVTATNSAGNANATLNVTVNDIAPTLSYTGNPFSYVVNDAITTAVATDGGGAITGCSSSPALPNGLALDPSTCYMTGTPTTVAPTANYTITATNSGGSATTTIAITVNGAGPNINYLATGYSFTYTKGTAITSLAPANTGGAITSCAVSPSLPGGLNFDNTTTCTISGTPAAVAGSASYTVTATNGGGSSSAVLTIAVQDVIPSISYSGSPFTFTKGVAITSQSPTNSGGSIVSCSASPALPAGLSLSSACVITGTPSSITAAGSYTITATNSGGSASTSINATVNDLVPAISYAGSPLTYTRNSAIATLTPTNTGGTVVSCSSSPTLPAGLAISSTCVLTGTPTAPTAAANYTITAVNTGGSAPATINVTVNDIAPAIAYAGSPFVFQQNVAISPLSVTTSGGNITGCGSTPGLPAGLSINNTTCQITGTPTAVTAGANHTIAATNSVGTGNAVIHITVTAQTPSIAYTGSPFAYTKGTAISALSATNSGGAITGCSSSPGLPAGLSIAATTCQITGTPTTITAAANYTVTATNGGGSSAATINLAINDSAPAINYLPSSYNFSYTINSAITALTPNNTGGAIVSCAISPTLPAGLSFSTATCSITGTPTALSAATSYSVTATNSGGSSAQTITIAINNVAPTIAYTGSPFAYTINSAIASLTPTNTGGAYVSCAVSPGLPNGLALSNGCVISGTPTAITASASYTVTGTNTGGSASATIVIAVNDHAPTLSYAGSPFTYTNGTAIAALTPTDTGGAITGCSSAPALPAGLSLSTACVLTGTPTAVAAAANYVITATNSGGSANATINITVKDIAPAFTYTGSPFTYTKGVVITTLTPNSTGGALTGCSSAPALPAGLSLSTACVLSGTPTAIVAAANYVITGTNTGGSANATINIEVNDAVPSIAYSPSTVTYTVRDAITAATPSNSGGAITGCSSAPGLPAGLTIAAATCAITGTPTAIQTSTAYTITATNTGGSATASISLTIDDQQQILFYGNTALAGGWNGTAPSSMNIWHASQDGTVVTKITNNSTANLGSENPTANAAGTSVVYASIQKEGATTSSSYNIFTSTPAGASLTYLTTNTAGSLDSSNNTFVSDTVGEGPVFSPDGTKIAFSSKAKVNGTTSGCYNIWVMSSTGTGMLALTQNTTAGLDSKDPVWSPDSTTIYFESMQGTATTLSAWNKAVSSSENIWSITADGTVLTGITADSTAGINSYDPVVSPSGTVVTYFSTEKLSGTTPSSYNIWQRSNTGSGAFALTTNTAAGLDSKYPSYSADGTEIVFSSKMLISGVTPSSYNVWTMTSAGASQTALTTNTAATLDAYLPQYSPDDTMVVFFSKMKIGATTANSNNLWLMNSNGASQTAITKNTNAGLDTYLAPHGAWYQPPP